MHGRILVDDETLVYGTQWRSPVPSAIVVGARRLPARCRDREARSKARFPWTAHEVGLLFMFSGFLGILLQGGLIGRLVKKFGELEALARRLRRREHRLRRARVRVHVAMCLLVAVFSAFGNGVLRPVITSRITQVAGRTSKASRSASPAR